MADCAHSGRVTTNSILVPAGRVMDAWVLAGDGCVSVDGSWIAAALAVKPRKETESKIAAKSFKIPPPEPAVSHLLDEDGKEKVDHVAPLKSSISLRAEP